MEVGDIPMFTSWPGSHDVWTSTGERLGGLVEESGLSRARRRIAQLDEANLDYQNWIIRASLATVASDQTWARRPTSAATPSDPGARPARLLAAARAVGDRLEALALRGADGGAGWIGLSITSRESWVLSPLWLDLYDGCPASPCSWPSSGRRPASRATPRWPSRAW